MRIVLACAVSAAVALMAGCSQHQGSAPTTGEVAASATPTVAAAAPIADPCSLLTQAEASAAMGAPVGPGQRKQFGKLTTRCSFSTASNDELFLDVSNPGLFDAATHMGAVPVAGIGDHALWQHDQYSSLLMIEKGGNVINMGLPRTIASPTPAVLKAGKLIAGRM